MPTSLKVFLVAILLAVTCVACGVLSFACDWGSKAVQVVTEEADPRALFTRYLWFKDAAAALDKKQADIHVYEAKFAMLMSAYAGTPRREWPRDDREQWALWASEVAGIKASYNQLAAEYNAAMAKINWRFTNVGDLPPGATTPLPREYKPYEVQ